MVDSRIHRSLPRLLPHQRRLLHRLHRFARYLVRPHVSHFETFLLNQLIARI